MKKKLVLVLSVVVAVSILLCACGKDNKQNKTNTNNESEITNASNIKEDNLNDTNVSDEVTNSTETDTIVDDTQTSSNSKEETTENNNTTKPNSATTNSSNTTKPSTNQQHTHNYSNATCTTAKKCSCGATSGNALGHSYSNVTCTTPKKCTRCGTTSGSALGHDYKKGVCSRCQAKDLNYVPSKYEQNLQVLKDYILANGIGSSGDYKFLYATDRRQLSTYSIYIYYYMKEDMIEFKVADKTDSLHFKVSQIENSVITVNYRRAYSLSSKVVVTHRATATINTNTYDGLADVFFEYTLDENSNGTQSTPNYYLSIGVENWKKLLLEANLTMNDLGFISCK